MHIEIRGVNLKLLQRIWQRITRKANEPYTPLITPVIVFPAQHNIRLNNQFCGQCGQPFPPTSLLGGSALYCGQCGQSRETLHIKAV